MSPGDPQPAPLETLTKLIQDLHDLVRLLLNGLACAKLWQRQLAAHLVDIEKQVDFLRLTVTMERPDIEILAAANHLTGMSRLAAAALAGSRVDPTTRTAVHMFADLANRIRTDLDLLG